MPFQEYRMWLVELMDNLLKVFDEKPNFKSFTLDGQTSIIEDYLEVRPEKKEILGKLIAEKKILVGPWYTQPDEWLASPESLVRNLLIGHRVGLRFGNVLKVGYVPDNFGHPSQLPQILRGFNIDNFVFMRGMGDEGDKLKTEFIWQAPEGSTAIAVHLIDSYVNAAFLGIPSSIRSQFLRLWEGPSGSPTYPRSLDNVLDEFDSKTLIDKVKQLTENLSPKSFLGTLLFMNGHDHAPAQPGIVDAIEFVNKQDLGVKLIHGGLLDYVGPLRSMTKRMQTYVGEFWGARYHYLLSGVLSTRMYLKQMNHQAEILLENYAEPLSCNASLFGYEYPKELLSLAWKLLLLNQAHDSIHGSSVDPVHVEMEARYQQVIQIANAVMYDALRYIANSVENFSDADALRVVVYNPSNWVRSDIVRLWVDVPSGNYVAVDKNGKVTPIQFLKEDHARFPKETLSHVAFITKDVPSNGIRQFVIVEDEKTKLKETQSSVRADSRSLENEFFRIEVDVDYGGALTITDKRNKAMYKNFNTFVDEGDHGDVWDYSPPKKGDTLVTSKNKRAQVEIVENGPVAATLKIDVDLDVPGKAEGDRRSKETVTMPITSYVSLYSGVPRIDVKTLVNNMAEDHRLRVVFPTGLRTSSINSDGLFYVNNRLIKNDIKGENWKQPPPTTFPQMFWLEVHDDERCVTIANKGLPEYECKEDKEGVNIYVTLMRCVGSLSKEDIITRKGHAGPPLLVPGAQCRRLHVFEYSIIPHRGDWAKSRLYQHAKNFVNPLTSWSVKGEGGNIPADDGFIKIKPDNLVISAIKRAEDDCSTILRFYEVTSKPCTAQIEVKKDYREAWITNLNEENTKKILIENGKIEVPVKAHEIITIKLKI
jgi:mannosylglycerate hydrolase